MKTTSAFMAVCTALLMFSCSGDDENSQSTPLQLKTTTSSPAKGEIGTKITIIGENFTDQAKVYLKNAKATITSIIHSPASFAGAITCSWVAVTDVIVAFAFFKYTLA